MHEMVKYAVVDLHFIFYLLLDLGNITLLDSVSFRFNTFSVASGRQQQCRNVYHDSLGFMYYGCTQWVYIHSANTVLT